MYTLKTRCKGAMALLCFPLLAATALVGCSAEKDMHDGMSAKNTTNAELLVRGDDALAYVDPMIGTDGLGHTYPGAAFPFGMIQLSPSSDTPDWKFCSGYHYSSNVIKGFAHNHFSGAGLSGLGDILVMPTRQATTFAGTDQDPDSGYRSRFSHDSEDAKAGYYQVYLDDAKTNAELTATARGGFHRYTFEGSEDRFLVIDPTHGINEATYESHIEVISDTEIRGYKKVYGYSAGDRTVYFIATFSQPFVAQLTSDNNVIDGQNATDVAVKALLQFDIAQSAQLNIKVALSHVSEEGALNNYNTDVAQYSFESALQHTQSVWANILDKINIASDSESKKRTFYTGMYHAFLSPNLISDVDGQYYLEGQVRQSAIPQYSNYSTWDTYRTLHPLWNIIDQQNNAKFVNSLVSRHAEQGLILPAWEGHGFDNRTMISYPTVSAISDAILRGVEGIDVNAAYQAIRATAFDTTKHSNVYDLNGMDTYLTYGFVTGETGSAVSKTTEQNYMDWTIARVAEKLALEDDKILFDQRSVGYRHYYHETSGYLMPRLSTGEHVSVDVTQWAPLIHNYISGNIWAYSAYTPHDMAGAISLHGGSEAYEHFLDRIFSDNAPIEGHQHPDISGFIGRYAHGDEPGHQMPYLYNFVGSPWKTQKFVNQILTQMYNDTPDGLVNNEDLGQMSAWYIFGTLGLYPVTPGDGIYQLGAPLHEQADIQLENGHTFSVIAQQLSKDNIYVQSVTLNGRPYSNSYITHDTIMAGGTLTFVMGDQPNTSFGANLKVNASIGQQVAVKVTRPLPPFAPTILTGRRLFNDTTTVTIAPDERDDKVYFTLDGTVPNAMSSIADSTITISADTTIKAISVDQAGNQSSVATATLFDSVLAKVDSPSISLNGKTDFGQSDGSLLFDGRLGSFAYSDGRWTGKRDVIEVGLNMGEAVGISSVSIGTLVDTVNGIFPAKSLRIYGVDKQGSKQLLGEETLDWEPVPENKRLMLEVPINGASQHYSQYHIVIEPFGDMPIWRTSTQAQGLLLVDEIVLKPID